MFFALLRWDVSTNDYEPAYGWKYGKREEMLELFGPVAKNGDVFASTSDNPFDSNARISIWRYFYGKKFYPTWEIGPDNAAKFVVAALKEIGDASSPESLLSAAIKCARQELAPQIPLNYYESFLLRNSRGWNCANVIQIRTKWRKKNGISRDCRTYQGQPGRNMVRKAA